MKDIDHLCDWIERQQLLNNKIFQQFSLENSLCSRYQNTPCSPAIYTLSLSLYHSSSPIDRSVPFHFAYNYLALVCFPLYFSSILTVSLYSHLDDSRQTISKLSNSGDCSREGSRSSTHSRRKQASRRISGFLFRFICTILFKLKFSGHPLCFPSYRRTSIQGWCIG